MISEDDKNKVRDATDLVALIQETVELKPRGNTDLWGCCPFHGEKTPSFHVIPSTQVWHCFGCGEGGDAFTYVMKRENLSFPESIRYLADRAGIELEEEDTYETGYADGMNQITVRRMQMVTVINRGAQSVIGTYGETAGSLLARMGITPGTGDTLSCSSETQTYDGMTIELVHTETRIEEEDTTVPYPVNYYEDPDLEPGAEIVLVAGQNGLTHVKSEVTYRNGKEVSRVIVQETVQTKPVTQLVIRGVDRTIMEQPADPEPTEQSVSSGSTSSGGSSSSGPSTSGGSRYDGSAETSGNVIMTSSGESYTYVDVMTCSATAYTCEGYVGHTYSGTLARVGAIAVDPTVIPLGTKMYVVSNDGQYVYGYCVAEDIGGGINGNKIDLYFDTYAECWDFGVRMCTVYILG